MKPYILKKTSRYYVPTEDSPNSEHILTYFKKRFGSYLALLGYMKVLCIHSAGSNFPRIDGKLKESPMAIRVTAAIKEAVIRESQIEGLTASEWLRNLIVKKLKEREALPKVYNFPKLEKKRY